MSGSITHATDADFDAEVLTSATPVLVDFWATWCRPCKAQAPMLEELARDYAGRLKVVKVEMDQNPKIAIACRVRSAPTLLLFKNGAVQVTQFGMVPEFALVGMVEATLVGLKAHRPARLGAPRGRRPARVSAARFRACRPR